MDIYYVKSIAKNNSFKRPSATTWIYITHLHSHHTTMTIPSPIPELRKNHLSFTQFSEAKWDISTQASLNQIPIDFKRKWIWKVNKALWLSVIQSPTDTQALTALTACSPEEEWTYNPDTQQIVSRSSPPKAGDFPNLTTSFSPPTITLNSPKNTQIETVLKTLCKDPLSHTLIDKAVITPYGNTFDKYSILNHILGSRKHGTVDPIAKLPISSEDLIDNTTVSLIIHQLKEIIGGKKRCLLCPIEKLPYHDPILINHNSPEGILLMTLIDPDTKFNLFLEGISYNRDCFEIPKIKEVTPPSLNLNREDVLIPNKLLAEIIDVLRLAHHTSSLIPHIIQC